MQAIMYLEVSVQHTYGHIRFSLMVKLKDQFLLSFFCHQSKIEEEAVST